MLACGIDVGSAATKAVIIDGNRVVQGRGRVNSGANLSRAARHAFLEACREAQCHEYDVTYILGTGFGRSNIPFSHSQATGTTCHARGAIFRYPETRTILDIGGQDTVAIRINEHGEVLDFCINDKCDAGNGRFIESVADLLNLSLSNIGELSLKADKKLEMANVCSVTGEVEIINYLEKGQDVEDIIAGIFATVADRASSLVRRIGIEEEVTLSGGVTANRGMVKALEEKLGVHINSGVDGVYIGAHGAALIALEKAEYTPGGW